jgi:outer membrane protein OmpA-like peptidoglycan-associated protein
MTDRELRQERGSGREIAMLIGVLALVAVGTVTTYWVRSRGAEAAGQTPVTASRPVQTPARGTAEPVAARVAAPAPLPPDVVHADVYFDFKSVRLRADGVRTLQDTVGGMDRSSTWGVLVQGHADLQGSAEYNRVLALRRAETVRQFLVELGIPEDAVRVATVGADGALCTEATRECQQLNRRVHVEVRRLRTATPAAVRPVVATEDALATPQGQ